jgi:hypothetical protein
MIHHPVRRAILASTLLAVALAGCGGATSTDNAKDFSDDKKAVAQAIDDFSEATSKSDEKAICTALLSRELVTKLDAGRATCADAVSDQLDAAGDSDIDVKAIAIAGARARATVVSQVNGHDRRQTLVLVREDDRWRLAGLG